MNSSILIENVKDIYNAANNQTSQRESIIQMRVHKLTTIRQLSFIANYQNLQILIVNNCNLTNFSQIPMNCLQQLQQLDVTQNLLKNFTNFFKLKKLQQLNISLNQFVIKSESTMMNQLEDLELIIFYGNASLNSLSLLSQFFIPQKQCYPRQNIILNNFVHETISYDICLKVDESKIIFNLNQNLITLINDSERCQLSILAILEGQQIGKIAYLDTQIGKLISSFVEFDYQKQQVDHFIILLYFQQLCFVSCFDVNNNRILLNYDNMNQLILDQTIQQNNQTAANSPESFTQCAIQSKQQKQVIELSAESSDEVIENDLQTNIPIQPLINTHNCELQPITQDTEIVHQESIFKESATETNLSQLILSPIPQSKPQKPFLSNLIQGTYLTFGYFNYKIEKLSICQSVLKQTQIIQIIIKKFVDFLKIQLNHQDALLIFQQSISNFNILTKQNICQSKEYVENQKLNVQLKLKYQNVVMPVKFEFMCIKQLDEQFNNQILLKETYNDCYILALVSYQQQQPLCQMLLSQNVVKQLPDIQKIQLSYQDAQNIIYCNAILSSNQQCIQEIVQYSPSFNFYFANTNPKNNQLLQSGSSNLLQIDKLFEYQKSGCIEIYCILNYGEINVQYQSEPLIVNIDLMVNNQLQQMDNSLQVTVNLNELEYNQMNIALKENKQETNSQLQEIIPFQSSFANNNSSTQIKYDQVRQSLIQKNQPDEIKKQYNIKSYKQILNQNQQIRKQNQRQSNSPKVQCARPKSIATKDDKQEIKQIIEQQQLTQTHHQDLNLSIQQPQSNIYLLPEVQQQNQQTIKQNFYMYEQIPQSISTQQPIINFEAKQSENDSQQLLDISNEQSIITEKLDGQLNSQQIQNQSHQAEIQQTVSSIGQQQVEGQQQPEQKKNSKLFSQSIIELSDKSDENTEPEIIQETSNQQNELNQLQLDTQQQLTILRNQYEQIPPFEFQVVQESNFLEVPLIILIKSTCSDKEPLITILQQLHYKKRNKQCENHKAGLYPSRANTKIELMKSENKIQIFKLIINFHMSDLGKNLHMHVYYEENVYLTVQITKQPVFTQDPQQMKVYQKLLNIKDLQFNNVDVFPFFQQQLYKDSTITLGSKKMKIELSEDNIFSTNAMEGDIIILSKRTLMYQYYIQQQKLQHYEAIDMEKEYGFIRNQFYNVFEYQQEKILQNIYFCQEFSKFFNKKYKVDINQLACEVRILIQQDQNLCYLLIFPSEQDLIRYYVKYQAVGGFIGDLNEVYQNVLLNCQTVDVEQTLQLDSVQCYINQFVNNKLKSSNYKPQINQKLRLNCDKDIISNHYIQLLYYNANNLLFMVQEAENDQFLPVRPVTGLCRCIALCGQYQTDLNIIEMQAMGDCSGKYQCVIRYFDQEVEANLEIKKSELIIKPEDTKKYKQLQFKFKNESVSHNIGLYDLFILLSNGKEQVQIILDDSIGYDIFNYIMQIFADQ